MKRVADAVGTAKHANRAYCDSVLLTDADNNRIWLYLTSRTIMRVEQSVHFQAYEERL